MAEGLLLVKAYVDSLVRPVPMPEVATAVFALIALVMVGAGIYVFWRYTTPNR